MEMIISIKGGGSSKLEGGVSCELHEIPLEPRQECHTKILSGSATIKRTVSSCQTEVLSGTVNTKLLPGSITIKHTAIESHD